MPTHHDIERLRGIKTFPSLIKYLRDDLEWPIDEDDIDEVFFDYNPDELGLTPEQSVGIKEIKQLRPLEGKQPWGIFWVNFEKKSLPVVMLRRILGHLVVKKRASSNKSAQRAWQLNDLLFISAYGEESDRAITLAHFAQDAESPGDLPILKVLGWDGGDTVLHLADAHQTLTEKLRWPEDPSNVESWRQQWGRVFTLRHHEVIETAQELVEELAHLATSIRKRADTILAGESERGPMRRLYAAFKTALIHDLSEDDFADVIAQTISYGLLAARFSRPAGISVQNLVDMVPPTNPFLRELLAEFLAVAGRKKGAFDFDELGIQDVVEVLNQANSEAVKSDFGNRTRNEDPVIHFYEHFLSAYDKKKKIQRGAFYTPQPVVSYIVRSVHELLQTEFGLEDGLADTTIWGEMAKRNRDLKIPEGAKPDDPFVMILDPATGTGTFLVEAIEVIFSHLNAKWKKLGKAPAEISKAWNEYVPKHLFPRLYGYEIMMAPYTIAHMKLGLKLSEINARLGQPDYQFKFEGRAHIYLTNSLEPAGDNIQHTLEGIFPALAHEATAVNAVKHNKRFTVVIGNPPYAGNSSNTGEWISSLVDDYYSVAGEPLRERNSKWLQDDYVKFIRLAQNFLAVAHAGVLGFITNHSFLDNPTFRGMRYSLLTTFSELRVFDLHGNSKKREKAPDGSVDENVFDIQQGVAITVGQVSAPHRFGIVCHAHLYGERTQKYAELSRSTASQTAWNTVSATGPFYFLFPQNVSIRAEYEKGIFLPEAMRVNVLGFQSHRDGFAIAFDRAEIRKRISMFRSTTHSDKELAKQFEILDNRDWQIASARSQVKADKKWEDKIITCAYRPFDFRTCYFSTVAMDYPRRELLEHVAWRQNLCINTTRQTKTSEWRNAVVTDKPAPAVFVELKDGSNVFPLWLYPEKDGLSFSSERRPNFSDSFLKTLSAQLQLPQKGAHGLPTGLTPEDIFHYTYAVFHSPGYRSRYAEFLKIDFPRLPLTSSLDLFRALANLGSELVALHLLESPKLDEHITEFTGGCNPEVEKVSWSKNTVWVDKTQTTGFKGVPEAVWNFHIGGYQVCEKWLKDRKGRKLSAEDITHYQKIVVALSETVRLMAEIDKVIEKHGGWPGAFLDKKREK